MGMVVPLGYQVDSGDPDCGSRERRDSTNHLCDCKGLGHAPTRQEACSENDTPAPTAPKIRLFPVTTSQPGGCFSS